MKVVAGEDRNHFRMCTHVEYMKILNTVISVKHLIDIVSSDDILDGYIS